MSRAMGSSCVFTCWGAASWHGGRVMLVFGARAAAGAGSCAVEARRLAWLWCVAARWWLSWPVVLPLCAVRVVAGGGC